MLWPEFSAHFWAGLELTSSRHRSLDRPRQPPIHLPGSLQTSHLLPELLQILILNWRAVSIPWIAPNNHPVTSTAPQSKSKAQCSYLRLLRHGRQVVWILDPCVFQRVLRFVRVCKDMSLRRDELQEALSQRFWAITFKSPTLECSGSRRVSPEPLGNDTSLEALIDKRKISTQTAKNCPLFKFWAVLGQNVSYECASNGIYGGYIWRWIAENAWKFTMF